MNIFKRILRIGQAEIHATVEKMEDPVRMTEQGLRELRRDLNEATEAYAKVKALAIRTENEQASCLKEAENYANKAVLVMEKSQAGHIDSERAETLAMEALRLRSQLQEDAAELAQQAEVHRASAAEMLKNIGIIKENLAKWEKELKTLRAKVKLSAATQKVNKQLAHIDDNDTIAMLERMKEKAEDQKAFAQAYGEIGAARSSMAEELDKVLNDKTASLEQELAAIKQQLGMKS